MATLNLSLPANHVPQKANLTQNQKPFCKAHPWPPMLTDGRCLQFNYDWWLWVH